MPTQDSRLAISSRPVFAVRAACLLSALWLTPPLALGDASTAAPTEKIGSAANFLMLPPDEQPGSFRNTDKLFASRLFKHGANVFALPPAAKPLTAVSYAVDGKKFGIDES